MFKEWERKGKRQDKEERKKENEGVPFIFVDLWLTTDIRSFVHSLKRHPRPFLRMTAAKTLGRNIHNNYIRTHNECTHNASFSGIVQVLRDM